MVASTLVADVPTTAPSGMSVTVAAQKNAKMKLVIGLVGGASAEHLQEVTEVLGKDFSFSGQFEVSTQAFEQVPSKQELQKLAQEGTPLIFFISEEPVALKKSDKKTDAPRTFIYEWRLYDTKLAHMVRGKKYHTRGSCVRGWAHNIADSVWDALTSEPGFFSSKMAFCKEVAATRGKRGFKHIYVADYDGTHEQPLVATQTVNVAPRWNRDEGNPLVFYSECTNANMRLMVADMNKRRGIASNFDGLNMQASFSSDGKKAVFCASRGDASCQLYYHEQRTFKKLTHNKGNNISPLFADNNSKVFYCSDIDRNMPQLFCYDFKTEQHEQITQGTTSFSPSYCERKNSVVYSKMVGGVGQLFVYDVARKTHKQITSDTEHKQEATFSPCGNYLLFETGKGIKNKLVMLNTLTGERKIIKDEKQGCSYPSWSGLFELFPVVI